MDKMKCAYVFFLSATSTQVLSFEKLDETYQIQFGSPEAKVHVTEYFSFSCPKCMKFIRESFSEIEERYTNCGSILWSFHPDPADIITVKAMIYMERMTQPQKQLFLKTIAEFLNNRTMGQADKLMKNIAIELGIDIQGIDSLLEIKETKAFHAAYDYVKQEECVSEVPTIEINGSIYNEYPNMTFIEKKLQDHVKKVEV